MNAKHLNDSVLFYNEIKSVKKLKAVSATIIQENTSLPNIMMTVRNGGATSVKAKAVFNSDEVYNMVCAYNKRLNEGMKVQIILCKKKNLFAFSIQQVKNALVTYLAYSIIFLGTSLFMVWLVYSIVAKF